MENHWGSIARTTFLFEKIPAGISVKNRLSHFANHIKNETNKNDFGLKSVLIVYFKLYVESFSKS